PSKPPGKSAQMVEVARQGLFTTPEGWPRFALGLAHLRADDWQPAITAATESLKRPWPGTIMNYPLLAMAHHRLGHAAEARGWLDKSRTEWNRLSPLRRSLASATVLPDAHRGTYWYDNWHDW